MSRENYIVICRTDAFKDGHLATTTRDIIWEGEESHVIVNLNNKYEVIKNKKNCRLIEFKTRESDYHQCVVLEYIEDINDTDCVRVKYRLLKEVL